MAERVGPPKIRTRTFLKGLVIIAGDALVRPDQTLAAAVSPDNTSQGKTPATASQVGELLYGKWERYAPGVDQSLRELLVKSGQGIDFEIVSTDNPTRALYWKDPRAEYSLSMILHQRPSAKPTLTAWATAWVDNQETFERRRLPDLADLTRDFTTPVTASRFSPGLRRMFYLLSANADRLSKPDPAIRVSPLSNIRLFATA